MVEQPRRVRLSHANELVAAVSRHGRRFFYYEKGNRVALFEIDLAGRLWWRDEYTDARVYVAYRQRWRKFSNGGTLRSLVEALARYIREGTPIHSGHFGPWPEWYCDGDLWGYGKEAMAALRAEIAGAPCIARAIDALPSPASAEESR